MNIEEVVKILYSKNSKEAYAALKVLLNVSAQSDELYPYFDQFVAMSEDADFYIRTRGLLLIAANARWDEDNKIDECIAQLLNRSLPGSSSKFCRKLLYISRIWRRTSKRRCAWQILKSMRTACSLWYIRISRRP